MAKAQTSKPSPQKSLLLLPLEDGATVEELQHVLFDEEMFAIFLYLILTVTVMVQLENPMFYGILVIE